MLPPHLQLDSASKFGAVTASNFKKLTTNCIGYGIIYLKIRNTKAYQKPKYVRGYEMTAVPTVDGRLKGVEYDDE